MNTIEIIAALKSHKIIPRLSGDQLKLAGDTTHMPVELLEAVKAMKQELILLLKDTGNHIIQPISKQNDYPASDAQKSIWMLQQLDETGAAYNIVTGLYLKGTVSVELLNKAFLYCIQRHESLRTTFKEVDGDLRQLISDDVLFETAFEDISGIAAIHDYLKAVIKKLTYHQFDLEKGPLLKVDVMRISDQGYAMVLVMHHIISDGWSVKILLQEVMAFYEALRKGETPAMDPLRIQYKDYAAWLSGKVQGIAGQRASQFWKEELNAEMDNLVLPSDFTRPGIITFEGAVAKFFPGIHFYSRILDYCKQHTATPFNFFLAALTVLLHKLSGQRTVTIGSPVAGRSHFDLQQQIGLFVNTLPLMTTVDVEAPFIDMLKTISANTLRAFEFQDYPFARIAEDLIVKRDTGRNPLFDVMLVLQDTAIGDGRINFNGLGDFELSRLDSYLNGTAQGIHESAPSKFDLCFNLGNDPDNKFYVEIEYAVNLFSKDNIVFFYNAYQHIISQVLLHPEEKIKDIELADQEEKQRLLSAFNATDAVYPAGKTVVDLFEEQVLSVPDHIGLLYEGRSLSYAQLNETANRLSHYLREVYQVGADDLVGIRMDRNEWLVISMLGVLKSGAAYVPIDPAYPEERIDYIIADSHCRVVLDGRELQKFLLHEEKYSQENPGIIRKPADLAYVIYTSGSTGRPKGVMITHGNVYAFIEWCREEFSASDYEVVLGVTSICFDLSVFEIFFTLVSGKQLRLLESALSIPKYLKSEVPLLLNTVPGVIAHLLSEGADLSRVSVLNMAGEPVPSNIVSQLDCDMMEVRNLYGPSEDTTYSTVFRLKTADRILIGRPISNTRIYILNDQDQLQSVGVAGEICISGAGLARGYLNQPALTAAKFTVNPFLEGERMYRTGDIGKWQPDGNIAYLGRKDDQVKIRGYRIETGEIVNTLERHEGVEAAVVSTCLQADGEKALIAYVVGKEQLDNTVLRSHLRTCLPDYMVPAYFIQLDAFPLLPNGKVNKKALPAPEAMELSAGFDYEAPRNATEVQLVQIWQDVLGREQIGIKDNFFELGGHSLKATRLASRVYKAFEVKVTLKDLFSHPVLENQAGLISASQKTLYFTIPQAAAESDYVLSSAQRRLWVLSQFEEGSAAYNMPAVFRFEGVLDADALSASFAALIERHEMLRTVFREEGGDVRQYILSSSVLGFKTGYYDLRGESEGDVRQKIESGLWRPFDLSKGPLLRADLYQTADDSWMFGYVMHHIISDGWSMEVLIRELLQLYAAYVQGQSAPLLPLRIQYKDYAVWQQRQLHELFSSEHKQYWVDQLSGALPVLEFPSDKVRPAVKTYNGGSVTRQMDVGGLRALCLSSDSTLFMGLVAAVNVLLYRYTGQEDIIIGSPVAGRAHSDLEEQIGFYVNTLALRTRFKGTDSFEELLSNVRQLTLDAYDHQSYPFDALIDELDLQMDLSRSALFDVLVVLQHQSNTLLVEKGFAGLRAEACEVAQELSKVDLQFSFIEEGNTITVKVTYNTDIYLNSSITQLAAHLEQLLSAITDMPGTPVGRLVYLSAAEQQTLLGFNAAAMSVSPVTLVSAFRQQAAHTPDSSALVFEQNRLTYRELDEASDKLAIYLRNTYQLNADDLAGIQLERSEWMIIALWGILKAGAAFVPIDPAYPQERIDYMVADSRCKVVIDEEVLNLFLLQVKDIHEVPADINTSSDLAYVIYTSGSTGRPKGVMISHGSLYNYITAIGSEYNLDEPERILQLSNFAFDAAVEQIMLSMLNGACLYVVSQSLITDPAGLTGYIADNGITHLHTVPTLLLDIDFTKTASLKRVVSAGEVCPLSLLQRIGDSILFYNKYGPTEATISATLYNAVDKGAYVTNIPIGRPLSNSRIYILNDSGQQQPFGVTGEIFIGGYSLARGYLNLPALTADRFVDDPWHPGAYMYRTGDIGKWQPDGNIVFSGRKDEQVKIRGHRIEPGEIIQVLEEYEGVTGAVVKAVKDSRGDNLLAAWLVSTAAINITDIRERVLSKLPHYMVPAYFIQLDAFPLLPNGKVNKKALPVPEATGQSAGFDYEAPRNATEVQLVQIWQDVLGREQIGIKDNFFELGGHSLKATRLASQVYKAFEVKVTLKDLFSHPVLEQQAGLISASQKTLYFTIPQAAAESDYVLSSAQRRLWVLSQFEEGSVAYNMPAVFRFEGVLDADALSASFAALIERHEILRTVFREEGGEVRQYILSSSALGFKTGYYDLRGESETYVWQKIESSLWGPFDLSQGPLLRADLYQTAEDSWMFGYVMHHIISDGWSMEVLIRELLQLYAAYAAGQSAPLLPLRIQYKDYAVWQQRQLHELFSSEHKQYWVDQLSGELPVLEFPSDKVRPAVKTYNGGSVTRVLDGDITAGFRSLCLSSDSTLFMGLVAAVNLLLYRYTGQEDIIIGSPVAGRAHSDLEEQIGFYVNTLALRTRFKGTDSFEELLSNVRKLTLDAYDHQSYPFDALIEELDLQRDLSRSALFDVLVVLQHQSNTLLVEEGFAGLRAEVCEGAQELSKFDLQFSFVEMGDQLQLHINYNNDLYYKDTIVQLSAHLEQLLAAITASPENAIGTLGYLSIREQIRLLDDFNATDVPYASDKTVIDLFAEQVSETPDHTALLYEEKTFNYRELNEMANQLAHYLKEVYDVSADDLIGLRLERNEWIIIALLGILKSGAAYVPIDPAYPQDRIDYIVADSQCKVVLDAKELNQFRANADHYSIENPEVVIGPADLAYVIYTSGSTGRPKGVMITQRNVYAFMQWCKDEFKGSHYDVVLAVTSVCFDLSIFEIFYTLVSGKQLRLLTDALSIPQYLNSPVPLLLNTVPSVVSSLLSAGADLSQVSVLNMAGEPIPAQTIRQLDCDRIAVRNLYGPSEDTTYSTVYRIKNGDSVLIGRPISNTRIYILSKHGVLQPTGVAGEICISGAGLARGYLNQPHLTAEKFIAHPFIAGELLYKTGDLGKWQSDGNIVFLGRMDEQVKIRGYRIEPGEITAVLNEHAAISAAVVINVKDKSGDNALVAYVVCSASTDIAELRMWLGKKLPYYMLPAQFIQLDELPLLPNGKLNKKALPAAAGLGLKIPYTAARNETEAQLLEIWQQIPGMERAGVLHNFFEMGGHSLKAIRLVSQIQKEFGVRINIKHLFMNPTVEGVAELIRAGIWLEHPQKNNKEDRIIVEI